VGEQTEELKRRTKRFALDVLAFVARQPHSDDGRGVRYQLVRAATSVGANYRSACRSRSRAEFIARIGVALEEADESAFWLEILIESGKAAEQPAHALLEEANQLTAILAASSLTAKTNARP
jgi:four helix bundle protein